MLLNNQEITEEIKEETKKMPRNKWQWKHHDSKPMECSKSSSKREAIQSSVKKHEKISNKQPKHTSKATRERRINKTPN